MNLFITFDRPWVLLGLCVFILIFLYDYRGEHGKRVYPNLPHHLQIKLVFSRVCFRISLACIIIALAGPRWGGEKRDEYSTRMQGQRTADVVIALDVSRSMYILDSQSTMTRVARIDRGLSIVKEAVAAMPGTRFAAAISRNRGVVAIPLTWDTDAVFSFLDTADSSLTGRGTNLESLVDTAAGIFQSYSPSSRVILLVSDGESLSGTLKTALERCKTEGITIMAIAVGSDEGGIVPGEEEIISRRDADTMRMAAGQTGGLYIDGNRDDAARTLVGHLRSFASGAEMRENEKERRSRWFIFVILGIIMLGASKLSLLKLRDRE